VRLGYKNLAKAAGRVHAICSGHLDNQRSRSALTRLALALHLPSAAVEQAIIDTRLAIAEERRAAREKEKAEQEAREAEWRRTFTPHAVILTERRVPSQITICALTGGPAAYLIIRFDIAKPSHTFVNQAVSGLAQKAPIRPDGRRCVMFFGSPTGLVVNYSPDLALLCDVAGQSIDYLTSAYRIGRTELMIGGRERSVGSLVTGLRWAPSQNFSGAL
jgi:hypothetical protein